MCSFFNDQIFHCDARRRFLRRNVLPLYKAFYLTFALMTKAKKLSVLGDVNLKNGRSSREHILR